MTKWQWTFLISGCVFIALAVGGSRILGPWSNVLGSMTEAFSLFLGLIQAVFALSSFTHNKSLKRMRPVSPLTANKPTINADSRNRVMGNTRPFIFFLAPLLIISLILFAIPFLISLFSGSSPSSTPYISVIYYDPPSKVRMVSDINEVVWSPDNKYIAAASVDGKVRIWDVMNKKTIYLYTGHKTSVSALAWSHDGTRIASGDSIGNIQVWVASSGDKSLTYTDHSGAINALAWSPHDIRIASASDDDTVKVWDVVDGVTVYTFIGHHAAINAVGWSSDGKRIFSIASDVKKQVQVWDATTGNNSITYSSSNPNDTVLAGAWAPDNTRIAFGVNNTVQVLDSTTLGKVVNIVCLGHQNTVNAVAWSPDSRYIASGSDDNTVRVCDSTTGENVVVYKGHSKSIRSLMWSNDGASIASAGDDGTVQVWNALSGKHLVTLNP